jgi:GNAT superfamily N-acetyltransferase
MPVEIRIALREDMSQVLNLIKELAVYEKAPNEVINSTKNLEEDGFGENKIFDCFVAELNGVIVGFALFYTGYSTWKGRTLYLEDILVTASERGKGIGAMLFEAVKSEAIKRGVKRMDWQVLEWNEPAIQFYKKYNATLDAEWINGRFFENDLH